MFPLHCISEILYAESIDTKLIIRVNFFSMTKRLSTIGLHPDGWETDDNGITDAYSIAVI